MHNKTLSSLIIVSLIMTSLSACNLNIKSQKAIGPDTPYYSVTIGSYDKSKNTYMNLDVEVPKITYSNESASSLIDPINAEIDTSLNTIIEEAKNKALATYESYIESAKTNAKKDIENRINNLKEKYKNVLGDEEVKLISEFSVDDLERKPFGRVFMATMSEFSNFFQPRFRNEPNDGQQIGNRGKNNWMEPNNNINENNNSSDRKNNIDKNNAQESKTDNKLKETTIDETVHGFTNSSDIINPDLHNKNIIIVETTEKKVSETTTESNSKGNGTRFKNRGTKSNANKITNEYKQNNTIEETKKQEYNNNRNTQELINDDKSENKVSTSSETSSDLKDSTDENIGLVNDLINEADINEEITLDNFYRDFRGIYMTRIPDDYTLAMYYIPTTITCNFEVKCLDEDFISLFIEISESRTTTMIKRLFYNVDLNKGKIINIKELLGEKYKETVVNTINSEIEKWTDDQKATLINNYSVEKYINDDTPYFINNNHRSVIQIEKFAITIGSAGYHEFQIP